MDNLNYCHPDIVWGQEYFCAEAITEHESIYRVSRYSGKFVRVYATKDYDSSGCFGGPVWKCTHIFFSPIDKKYQRCGYYPGIERTIPLPGQHCHNCGGIRAEEWRKK
jgi:hypothetical protein